MALENFDTAPGGYQGYCKACSLLHKKQERKDNPERFAGYIKKQQAIRKAWLIEIKESTPCTDCGKYYAAVVMDFDHLPQFEKAFQITWGVIQGTARSKILAEMAKCELVCANCHRERTHARVEENYLARLADYAETITKPRVEVH